MSLRVWLPLNGDLHNQGIQNITITNNGATVNNNGKIGKCYYFNNNTIVFDSFSTTKSISFWIKATKTKSTIAFVDYQSKLAFGFNASGYIVTSCDELSIEMYRSQNFISDKWNHIVVVKKSTDIELWINGVLQTDRVSANYWRNSTDACYLGGRSDGNYMICYLNDFRVYDHQLSKQEIKKLSQGLILHYPLNRKGWGQENLLKASNVPVTNSSYCIQSYYFGDNPPQADEQVTIQIKGHLADTKSYWYVYNSGGTVRCLQIQKDTYNENTGIYTMTGEWKTQRDTTTATNTYINVYAFTRSQSGESTIEWIKLERGNKATPWCPNAADDIYTTLGLGDNIQYDISGYQNNGVKNNITYDNDTPKYNVSSVFNSANTSYIKVNENNWAAQYTEKITVNVWAYSLDWANVQKLYSCIQTGGWGTTMATDTTGYMRICGYVATNEERTSHSYVFNNRELHISAIPSGWHMITYVYDVDIGHKVYLDGILHSNYDFVSYGIKYNMNARLFLGCEASSAAKPTSPYFDGKLSDFRVYATALSDKDILSLYNNEAYIDQSNKIYGQKR